MNRSHKRLNRFMQHVLAAEKAAGIVYDIIGNPEKNIPAYPVSTPRERMQRAISEIADGDLKRHYRNVLNVNATGSNQFLLLPLAA